jgi:Tol biopolymer transport system component
MRATKVTALFAVACAVVFGGVATAASGDTVRVSVSSAGAEGSSFSDTPSISADGRYVAFRSIAENLVAGDTNGAFDVFVHDRQTGVTERVSVSSGGVEGNRDSDLPSISADGRHVAFRSSASNLVAGDTNGTADVFVYDRQSGTTERVSVGSAGAQGNDASWNPSISADGHYVAFWSFASNLVAGDTNGSEDVFVHDRQSGATERVSVGSGGTQGNGRSNYPSISADGRYVAFSSEASNLVSGDTNGSHDVFVHDRQSGATARVSVSSGGVEGNRWSQVPSISADGRYVAFLSFASSLVPGDTNGREDVFVHDRQTGVTERVSVSSGGVQGNWDSGVGSISADGRYVAFRSFAENLVAGDTNGTYDVFVHDRQSGATDRVSVSSGGVQGNDRSEESSISADGRFVAFSSFASNLVAGDTNLLSDVFVHEYTLSVPPFSFKLKQSAVAGCKSVAGTVTLSEPAPPEGLVVALSDTLAAASTPATLKILAGAASKTFTVKTFPVSASESGAVSATLDGKTASQDLTVRPMGLTSVTLTPTSVVGSNPATGKATLECIAGPGPITVDLSSNNPAVANPVATSIVVPQGLKTANFDVSTGVVQTRSYATISGTANGITKSKKLTVNVAAAVSPTRLGFGSVTVGTMGGPLSVILTNRGAVQFSVAEISLTGTGASWFAQSHNCPATLNPGVSCTISVTFAPLAAGSKSAKLSIATSATSVPLSVSLSGTGI